MYWTLEEQDSLLPVQTGSGTYPDTSSVDVEAFFFSGGLKRLQREGTA